MRISMPRGDIHLVHFYIRNPDNTLTDIDFDEIYFTVKRTTKDKDYLFQKRLSTQDIIKLKSGDYQVKIEPADTETLAYGNYKFDVQVSWKDEEQIEQIKETFVGDFAITEEVTFVGNE